VKIHGDIKHCYYSVNCLILEIFERLYYSLLKTFLNLEIAGDDGNLFEQIS